MKAILILSLILACAYAGFFRETKEDIKDMWSQWKQKNHRAYKSVWEETKRYANFAENYAKIIASNKLFSKIKLNINEFADMTSSEFKSMMNGLRRKDTPDPAPTLTFDENGLPSYVDWRMTGALSNVKNQGTCGSCWTFSTVATLEALHQIKTGLLVDLAEQNLLDCVTESFGCKGGFPNSAFNYVANYGIQTEAHYPYQNKAGQCHDNHNQAIMINGGYNNVAPNVHQLKAAVAKQPVVVGIQADGKNIQFYSGGVITDCGADVDHAVVLVGYTVKDGQDVWIVRNSWGTNWGDKGYFYVSMDGSANNGKGVCGILTMASYPTA